MKLTIDFQEGFDRDEAIVTVDGHKRLSLSELITDYTIGRAESRAWDERAGELKIVIDVPNRQLTTALTINMENPVFIGVKIEDGVLAHRIQGEPFVYF